MIRRVRSCTNLATRHNSKHIPCIIIHQILTEYAAKIGEYPIASISRENMLVFCLWTVFFFQSSQVSSSYALIKLFASGNR